MERTCYGELLKERGLEWGSTSLENADVSSMDAQGIMAMLMGIVRGERFCDDAVLSACKSGSIVRWLVVKQIVFTICLRPPGEIVSVTNFLP